MKPKKYNRLLKAIQRLEDCQGMAKALQDSRISEIEARQKLTNSLENELLALRKSVLKLV